MYYVVNVQSGKVLRVFKNKSDAKRCVRRLIRRSVPVIIVERRNRGECR